MQIIDNNYMFYVNKCKFYKVCIYIYTSIQNNGNSNKINGLQVV